MMRLAILLAACGASAPTASPHEAATCDKASWGPQFDTCDLACVTKPVENGPACGGCATTFETEGQAGCCVVSYTEVISPDRTIAAAVGHAAFVECR